MILIAPESAPQILRPPPVTSPPPPPPKLDWLDQRILDLVGECEPAKLWSILNLVGDGMSPNGRAEARELRLSLLRRVERLIHLGLLHRGRRNLVATYKFMAKPTPRRARCRKPSVAKTIFTKAVSEPMPPPLPKQDCSPIPFCAQVFGANQVVQQPTLTEEKTESAAQYAQIEQAARTLARLPRNHPRKMTGWLHGQHCWRGRLLVLRNGEVAPLNWSSRGRVLLLNYKNLEVPDFLRWGAIREDDVRIYKCPEAVLLGSLKQGVRERPSVLKAATARANGCSPCRNGKKRGRPRKV